MRDFDLGVDGNSFRFGLSRFDEKENISGFQQLKTSVQKGIRNKIVEQFPYIENCINDVLPKKDPFRLMKW